ncbi:hypothetical protein [Roseimaritima ulvae]|uniref:Uncharacterized protein n=1 Tax=Roseimaritima ulvae TaxID=980254 RepID=A0A5B9R8C3_9BACT|nr:hypothetical protein [Roseimaritima ulvae]QEG43021.1 hypothetical protein UC8_50640 [Roseimaritima ulvae]
MPGPDDSNPTEAPYGEGEIPNPYQPVDTTQPLAAPPRAAVDAVSRDVNRAIGGVILGLTLLGIVLLLGNGAPLVAAVLLLSPVFPAAGVFAFRTCRLTWWADMWINLAISVVLGISVVIAAAVVCTAVVMTI